MIVGCANVSQKPIIDVEKPVQPTISVADYFPTSLGSTWIYSIKLSPTGAYFSKDQFTRQGKDHILTNKRDQLKPTGNENDFRLTFRIKTKPQIQPPIDKIKSVEVEVVNDELGLFKGKGETHRLFWSVPDCKMNQVIQVEMIHTDKLSAKQKAKGRSKDSFDTQFILTDPVLDGPMSLGDAVSKSFEFVGREDDRLHYRREVASDHTDKVGQAFTEDIWYKEGTGLIKLVQTIDGKTTMTWSLIEFTPGDS